MDRNAQWLQWAIELQSLAQAGLTYGKDVYDHERYERIREISAEILAYMTDIPLNKVKTLFCNESGYQTPKIDTRAAIFRKMICRSLQQKRIIRNKSKCVLPRTVQIIGKPNSIDIKLS